MTVQVTASISFESDTIETAQAEINSWALPAGAFVSSSASVPVTTGIVDDGGDIVDPPPPVFDQEVEEPDGQTTE
jgi:hypothetical protein